MKKLFLSLLAAGMAFAASAQQPTPAPGLIALGDCPGGIGSIEFSGDWVVNRECPEMATLTHNGLIIKMVPASNVPDVYTFEGFDRVPHGSAHLTFFNSQISEASQFGIFKVYIPEGYFLEYGTNDPFPERTYEYSINAVRGDLTPANGSTVEQIEKIWITFPEGVTISSADASKITFDTSETIDTGETDSDGDPILEVVSVSASEVKISSRVAEVIFEKTITSPGRNQLEVAAGAFTLNSSIPGLTGTYKNNTFSGAYNIIEKIDSEWEVSPATGTFSEGIPANLYAQDFEYNAYSTADLYAYFILKNEENKIGMTRALEFCKINDDGSKTKVADLKVIKIDDHTLALVNNDDSTKPVKLACAPGKYTIFVKAGKIYTNGFTPNAEFSIGEYVVTAPEVKNYTVSPSPTEKLDQISEIRFTYPENTVIEWKNSQYATFTNGAAQYMIKGAVEENELIFTFFVPVTLPGDWTLNVGTDALTVNREAAVINETFKIAEPEKLPVEVTTPNGIDTKVEFIEDEDWGQVLNIETTATSENNTGMVDIEFAIPEGYDSMIYYCLNIATNSLKKTTVDEMISNGWEKGNVISVPVGAKDAMYGIMFAKDNVVNEAEASYRALITVNYPVGVKVIELNGKLDVYSITGVKVSTDGNLSNLAKGLYIVNGQKVLIK